MLRGRGSVTSQLERESHGVWGGKIEEDRLNRRKRVNISIQPFSSSPSSRLSMRLPGHVPPGLKTSEASNAQTPLEGLQLFIPSSFVHCYILLINYEAEDG